MSCECCSLCKGTDCACGPCEMCPPGQRRFHMSQKDSLCEECLICNTCNQSTMYWDSYDEAWECSKCNEEWEEYDRKEITENPLHNARKDIPKYMKYGLWKSLLGEAKEAKCFSCQITTIQAPKFCILQKGGDFLMICVQCSKNEF